MSTDIVSFTDEEEEREKKKRSNYRSAEFQFRYFRVQNQFLFRHHTK